MALSFDNKIEKHPVDVWTRVKKEALDKLRDPKNNIAEDVIRKAELLLDDEEFKKKRKSQWVPVIDSPERQEEIWAEALYRELKNPNQEK